MNNKTKEALFGIIFAIIVLFLMGYDEIVATFFSFFKALLPALWDNIIKDMVVQRIFYIVVLLFATGLGVFLTKRTKKKIYAVIGGVLSIASIYALYNTK